MTLGTAAILAKVQDIFRAELEDDDLAAGLDMRQSDMKAWDSLAHVRLVSAIEETFGIQFKLEEIERITTIRHFVDLIESHLK